MSAKPPTGAPAPVRLPKSAADDVLSAFEKKASLIADAIAQAAEGGDVAAARLVFDRVAPAPRERAVRFSLPPIDGPADLPRAVLALMEAAARGDLVPGEAVQLAGVLEQYRRQTETADLAARIAALEEFNAKS